MASVLLASAVDASAGALPVVAAPAASSAGAVVAATSTGALCAGAVAVVDGSLGAAAAAGSETPLSAVVRLCVVVVAPSVVGVLVAGVVDALCVVGAPLPAGEVMLVPDVEKVLEVPEPELVEAVLASGCCVEAPGIDAPDRYVCGFTGVPSTRVSKWRCGPVQFPVQPT
jgi:hypothetical protein